MYSHQTVSNANGHSWHLNLLAIPSQAQIMARFQPWANGAGNTDLIRFMTNKLVKLPQL